MDVLILCLGLGAIIWLVLKLYKDGIENGRESRPPEKVRPAKPRSSPPAKPGSETRKDPERRAAGTPPGQQFNADTESDEVPIEGFPSRQGKIRERPVTSGVEHDPPPPIPASLKLRGRAWVIDGDTIAIRGIKVRLAGIDAPELDQPWGQKSKWAMVKLCKGQIIDVELTGETSYDRLVGTCYQQDGSDIGAELIKQGLALDGGHFSKGKYRHLEPDGVRRRLRYYGRWR